MAYQFVAQLGFERDSWVAPVDVRRVGPEEDDNHVVAEQVKALVVRLPTDTAAQCHALVRLRRRLRPSAAGRRHSGRRPSA